MDKQVLEVMLILCKYFLSYFGCVHDFLGGTDSSYVHSFSHSGQVKTGHPPGFSGGNESMMISSTHEVKLQVRHRYWYQVLGSLNGNPRGLLSGL